MLKRYLFAGLLVWLPLWATVVVLRFIVRLLDNTSLLLPEQYQPDQVLGFHVPGLGLVLALAILLVTGVVATNFVGKQLVSFWESLLARIPFVRTIYTAVKQVLETLFSPSGQSFRQVLLIEYPRRGLWSVAFQTGQGSPEFNNRVGQHLVTVFVPTTPNPTSGFLMMVDEKDTIAVDMSVDEALKWVISLGVVQPAVVGQHTLKKSTN